MSETTTRQKHSCGIVVPVYNEEHAIADTIGGLKAVTAAIEGWSFEIICVNDGSTDGTAEILKSLDGIRVITHPVNRGYGAALRTGLNACRKEWVSIVDADGTYPIAELGALLKEAENGADMVVGARRGIGITLNPFRRFARWILRKMAHMLTGTMVPDLNSGMRVFKHSLYREFRNLLPMGFSFTTTLTMAALYSNYRTVYLPINYQKRVGKSGIRPVRDFLGFSILIIRIASYFEPLRFFLPIALTVVGMGVLKGMIDFFWGSPGQVGSLAVIVVLMGVQFFITGILAEVIVRRSVDVSEAKSPVTE